MKLIMSWLKMRIMCAFLTGLEQQGSVRSWLKPFLRGQNEAEGARVIAKHLPARIDLHTTVFSATLKGKQEVVVPAFKVKALRATGAGDAWCACNILGDHNGLSDECRLMLANAC